MPKFAHLHVHSQYSLLDGAADIKKMFEKAKADGMEALALTDHGNMFGAFSFVSQAVKSGLKPIVGCEFYLVDNRFEKEFKGGKKDVRRHQLLLAKNSEGYKNLTKLCSLGYIDGMYSKWPRIDKELILKYHEGIIATSCCIGAEIPQTILFEGAEAAEKKLKWWIDVFGKEDYYIELQRHGIENIDNTGLSQEDVNQVLLGFAKKYDLKIIATNDSHYVNEEDSTAQDILLCVNMGEKRDTPIGEGKGYRFCFPNNKFFLKTQEQMNELFKDLPVAIDNTMEIVSKVDTISLHKDLLLPNFELPLGFENQDIYLRHLTYKGAEEKFEAITDEVRERLDFELSVIEKMGFAGYFLIVADFIKAGREMGVYIGPGRGSAAGSAVAYCTGITNVDPIKYDLLFERFLNPDRKSMPDIDTDFDDDRQKVIDYVVDKYGKNQVAQIITYGTMAAKSSIKDVARVLDLPLNDSNALANLVPTKPGIELNRLISAPLTGKDSLKEKEALDGDDFENAKKLREIYNENSLRGEVLKEAFKLEGTVRNTGIHAAGVIIAPKDLTELIPVCTSTESNLLITQFEGSDIENAGVIKMDFLGLKNLSIIKDCLKLIKKLRKEDLDIDKISLNDTKTFELYQKGQTNGTFQFESAGMQKYLIDLKPDKLEDLIAMNALYRPGPLAYIPKFINRKHGIEKVEYDLPELEEYLGETYGITVYQEQVMLLSQKLANFTKGEADTLRKAMGKKDRSTLDKMKPKFMEGCQSNNLDSKKCEKIWSDWEAFASYAFNKSHSTCYAIVAYQTAYLKTNYSVEYMASILTHHLSNIDKLSFFLNECRNMGIKVLVPNINESEKDFAPNQNGQIRFGLGGIKGTGDAAVSSIIEEREANGKFTSIFNFVERINLRTVNKKTLESLCLSGAFDEFSEVNRGLLMSKENDSHPTFIERLIQYGNSYQTEKENLTSSLFGESSGVIVSPPKIPNIPDYDPLLKLKFEYEVIGIYLSGHPLDEFKTFIKRKCISTNQIPPNTNKQPFKMAGIITKANHRGAPVTTWAEIVIQDFDGEYSFNLYKENYLKHKHLLEAGRRILLTAQWKMAWSRNENKEEPRLEIMSIQLLDEAKLHIPKNVVMKLHIDIINLEFEKLIDSLFTENNANAHLELLIDTNLQGNNPSVQRLKPIPIFLDFSDMDRLDNYEGVQVEFK